MINISKLSAKKLSLVFICSFIFLCLIISLAIVFSGVDSDHSQKLLDACIDSVKVSLGAIVGLLVTDGGKDE